QAVHLASATDAALEVERRTPDSDASMLAAIVNVLADKRKPIDAARLDPFWRRLLKHPESSLRGAALDVLDSIEHGPMADVLVPILRSATAPPEHRRRAIVAIRHETWKPFDDLLWAI